ncbi:MAG: hypothetical protein KDB04_00115 [Acidimicrobiales bacterium]|nr:hypothetical protein [Acidimicrobiales bacterium]
MTTPPTPFSDEELSASIDGELDADRAAAIAADPHARARRDELAAVAALVAAPVAPLPAEAVDQLIAVALDPPAAPPAPARRIRGPQPWLVAAAVVVLVAVGLALVWSGRNDGEQASFTTVGASIADGGGSSATEADGAGDVAADVGAESSSTERGDANAPTTTAPPLTTATTLAPGGTAAALPLGTFASGDEMRAALAEAFPATATPVEGVEAPPAAAFERCASQLQVTLDLDTDPTHTGYASVAGQVALVYEFATPGFDDGQPTTLVAAVGRDACDPIAIFQR